MEPLLLSTGPANSVNPANQSLSNRKSLKDFIRLALDDKIIRVAIEIFAVVFVAYCLQRLYVTLAVKAILLNPSLGSKLLVLERFYFSSVISPVVEEVFLRLFIQNGVGFFQRIFKVYDSLGNNEEEKINAQIYRVRITAVLSGLFYISRSKASLEIKLLQFVSASLSSLGNGYIYEKYNTLSLPILAHAVHNIIISSSSSVINLIGMHTALVLFIAKSNLIYGIVNK